MNTSLSLDSKSYDLRINEIFYSIQGESLKVGLPTVFIRLTGCPLRCAYCDTEYAFYEGHKMSIKQIVHEVSQYQIASNNHQLQVCVTGGEPVAQKGCTDLLSHLCEQGYQVSIETSGALSLEHIDKRVMKIVDIKTPASEEESKNDYNNLNYLNQHDQLKFAICNIEDYRWSKNKIQEFNLLDYCEVLFSPSHDQLSATEIANWILQDQLNVRLQIQLHKYLWGDQRGH